MKISHYTIFPLLMVALLFVAVSCEPNPTPLPRGYFRIALPEKEYRKFDSVFPYVFSYPVYAQIRPDKRADAEPWWADVVFPQFGASLHLSYKSVGSEEQLFAYMEDAHNFVNKHIPKATGFQERVYTDEDNRVFGILYEIRGKEAASPMQFYLTDSTRHFLRGALYFNVTPNNDSLAPVIRFIQDDIMILIESLNWN
ncbi:MAG: gliding motility lipoprotein GldD [Bacteroidales bacterium]